MRIECAHDALIPVHELKPHPRNPNTHPKEQVALLAKILTFQGFRAPIVVSTRSGYITKGHGRRDAAIVAGFERVPVDFQDYANEEAEIADMIADNRLSELSARDTGTLKELMEGLDTGAFDMELTGYDEDALKELMAPELGGGGTPEFPGEVPFSEELMLEHNYVVLYFDNAFDWQVAQDALGLTEVKDMLPRKAQPRGIGRVIQGAPVIAKLRGMP